MSRHVSPNTQDLYQNAPTQKADSGVEEGRAAEGPAADELARLLAGLSAPCTYERLADCNEVAEATTSIVQVRCPFHVGRTCP
jgi:hypothetical protein